MTEFLAAQLDREAPLSRRALERVPEGRPDWKPHPKSMPLGYLATLVAMMPAWIEMTIARDELDLKPPPGAEAFKSPQWSTKRELLGVHEDSVAKGRQALQGTSDDFLMTPWRLLMTGKVVMESPRYVVIADTFTHLAHHRGQLTVYLGLNEVPVPAIYGPSADDARF
jgi:uncharacterized damage-inducible protein DinB